MKAEIKGKGKIGKRVQLHPSTEGDRFGTIVRVTEKHAFVKMEKSKRKLRVEWKFILPIWEETDKSQ